MNRYLLLLILITVFFACNNDDSVQRLSPGLAWIETIEERERIYTDFDTDLYDTTITETPFAIQEDLDGNTLIALNGNINRYDSDGSLIQIDSSQYEIQGCQPLSNGNYFVFGVDNNGQNYVFSIDAFFNEIWSNTITTPFPSQTKFIIYSNNNFYVLSNANNPLSRSWITKLDNNRNQIWQHELSGFAESMVLTNDGNILFSHISPQFTNVQVSKLSDADGSLLSNQIFRTSNISKALLKKNSTDYYLLTTDVSTISNLYRFDENLNELERLDAGINVVQFEVYDDGIILVSAKDGSTGLLSVIAVSDIEITIKKITFSGANIWAMLFPIELKDTVENLEIKTMSDNSIALLVYAKKTYFLAKTNRE